MPYGTVSTATIGRDQQLQLIDELIGKIANRNGTSLLFSGEPGIGKSHLLREATSRSKAFSLRTISLRCSQNDINEPFALFSRLGAMFDIPEPESLLTDAARFRFGRMALDAAAQFPTIIMIDDMQWCDYLSSVALLHLFDYGSNLGLGFLATTRPIDPTEDTGAIVTMRTLTQLMTHIPLSGLSQQETTALILQVTSSGLTPIIEQSLQQLTNGNPFFLLEILRTDSYVNSLQEAKIPRELAAILDQKINLLNGQEDILSMAALLGIRGEQRILYMSLINLGYEDGAIAQAIQSAERLGLISTVEDSYEFRHALYTQRLVSRMSYAQRATFHGAATVSLANESRHMAAMAHLAQSEKFVDLEFGTSLANTAFQLSLQLGDHAGVSEAGTWLLENTSQDIAQRVSVLIELAKAQVAIGRRFEGRTNAELAATLARSIGDVELEAIAIMQWASRSDFTPDRAPIITAFENIDIRKLTANTRVQFLSAYSQAVLLVPTEEFVSVTSGSRLVSTFGSSSVQRSLPDTTNNVAWNWNVQAQLARQLATDARNEAFALSEDQVGVDTRVQALLAWRESHRSPQFLTERLLTTELAVSISTAASQQSESADFCHILDLLESGDFIRADLELQQFVSRSRTGGTFIAQWWSGFINCGRLVSQGKFSEARAEAQLVFERGELADEPGRLVIMLEQQTIIMLESIIPPELSEVFQGETELLANHYARVLAALANASLGNSQIAEQYINVTLDVFDDVDKEAAWLPTVTMLIETAHLLGLFDIAARGSVLLEPFTRHQVTYIGNTIRGPVRRYCALAKHASGDIHGAVDDLLMARNETRRIGDHLWDLACSVDILEILADTDPVRALDLVPESIIIDAEASEMQWRAQRGRTALLRARDSLATSLGLSARQILVLRGLLQNLTISEIAADLGFSHSTVRQESIALYKVLQIEGRAFIAERALELRLA